jgi:hypothetical protein
MQRTPNPIRRPATLALLAAFLLGRVRKPALG